MDKNIVLIGNDSLKYIDYMFGYVCNSDTVSEWLKSRENAFKPINIFNNDYGDDDSSSIAHRTLKTIGFLVPNEKYIAKYNTYEFNNGYIGKLSAFNEFSNRVANFTTGASIMGRMPGLSNTLVERSQIENTPEFAQLLSCIEREYPVKSSLAVYKEHVDSSSKPFNKLIIDSMRNMGYDIISDFSDSYRFTSDMKGGVGDSQTEKTFSAEALINTYCSNLKDSTNPLKETIKDMFEKDLSAIDILIKLSNPLMSSPKSYSVKSEISDLYTEFIHIVINSNDPDYRKELERTHPNKIAELITKSANAENLVLLQIIIDCIKTRRFERAMTTDGMIILSETLVSALGRIDSGNIKGFHLSDPITTYEKLNRFLVEVESRLFKEELNLIIPVPSSKDDTDGVCKKCATVPCVCGSRLPKNRL